MHVKRNILKQKPILNYLFGGKISGKIFMCEGRLYKRHHFLIQMPRGQITKDEMKVRVLSLKNRVENEPTPYKKEKELAHKYLNEVLFIIDQYAR